MHSISKNLKNIRKKKGWTQQQMADCLFVTRQTISNWENGRALPDLETIEQISQKLEIDSRYLLYGKLTEKNYRKLKSFSGTLIMTVILFLFLIAEKISYSVLRRISEYAGYHIFESNIGYGDWICSGMLSFFAVLWMLVLLFNWAIADSDAVLSKIIKIITNSFLAVILLYSAYSMVGNCLYTYNRYKNVVVTAHQGFEMTDNPSGLVTYRYESLEFLASADVNNIAYIDNNDSKTDEFMDYLINSQALKISRFDADSNFAKRLMWEHNFSTVPAVIIVTSGNFEVLQGYDEISSKLESKIHNYKMHNIFFY